MKRVLVLALTFGVVSAAVLMAQTKAAAGSEDAVLQADHALVNALEKGDTATSRDFGDAVVAVELQPTWGGKAYWSSRVFANHGNGFWKMEESYHTTIQAAPRMTAVNPAKASTN